MGAGKTTTGRRLANSLGWTFADLDDMIVAAEGQSINQIFTRSGEDYFRKLEARVLRQTESDSKLVISCGGGTPCYNDNIDFMNKTGLTIYLQMSPKALYSRLSRSKSRRPLIQDIDDSDLEEYLTQKLSEREEWYKKAKIIADGLNLNIERLTSIVLGDLP